MTNSSTTEATVCNVSYSHAAAPMATVYSLVLIFGVPTNLLTLGLSALKIWRKNVLSIYLFTLSLSDLIYLGTIPHWISYVRNSNRWDHSLTACQITGYIFFNNLYISIFLLCCISIDRCLVVLQPIESQWRRRRRTAVSICATIWVLVMLIHMPVFIMSGLQSTSTKNDSCFETFPMPPLVAKFNYARFCVGFCVPFGILVSTNLLIFRRIQSSHGLNLAQKTKVKYLAVAVILIFLVCFAPYHTILLSRAAAHTMYENSCWFEQRIYMVSTVFLCLCTVNSVLNPFLYMFSSESVRQELVRDLRLLACIPAPQETVTESGILRGSPGSLMSASPREELPGEN